MHLPQLRNERNSTLFALLPNSAAEINQCYPNKSLIFMTP